ncbi:MAG: transposase [Erysipelotrichaceae bacterium]|nr:transposase [Erysipelotrichaceae bacterium]
MKVVHGSKVRLYPNKAQAEKIDTTLDCCRFVYNHMLARNEKVYVRRGEHLSRFDMQNLLPEIKEYKPWLKDVDSQALKFVCRQINNAFDKFFKKRTGFPKFKSKKNPLQSYTTTNMSCFAYEKRKLKLPCLGWIKSSKVREFPNDAKICFCTISKENGKYYCSITYKYEIDVVPVIVDENQVIGLDYKSDGLFMDSNGNVADMPHFFRNAQKRLRKAQRKLAHMIESHITGYKTVFGKRHPIYDRPLETCKRIQKQISKVAKLQKEVANHRNDYLHKLSVQMANINDAVIIEDLDIKAMSNKGFGLGKATMDNGYGKFIELLSYKLFERGKQIIKVDQFFPSSQQCSRCGSIKKIPLPQRTYQCECGLTIDRDLNAAINIRNEGLRILALT